MKKSPFCQKKKKKKNWGKPPSFVQNTHFGGKVAENKDFQVVELVKQIFQPLKKSPSKVEFLEVCKMIVEECRIGGFVTKSGGLEVVGRV